MSFVRHISFVNCVYLNAWFSKIAFQCSFVATKSNGQITRAFKRKNNSCPSLRDYRPTIIFHLIAALYGLHSGRDLVVLNVHCAFVFASDLVSLWRLFSGVIFNIEMEN